MSFNLKIKSKIRNILFYPFKILNILAIAYSKLLNFIDPNGSERTWEELVQKQIDSRINSNFRFNHDEYMSKKFDYKKKINFFTPTRLASYRAKTLFSKEKDTIEWIDKKGGKDKVFFDIGANVGMYSLYYAHVFEGKVFSFEPSFRNLDLLARNINLNNYNENINVIACPIFKSKSINFFSQPVTGGGHAGGATYGLKKKNISNYKTLSLTIDYLVESQIIDAPDLIKIDVDGNEIEILQGSIKTIQLDSCKSILVETRNSTGNQVHEILKEAKFKRIQLENKGINEFWEKN
jgi:FkbM family methyltransferase